MPNHSCAAISILDLLKEAKWTIKSEIWDSDFPEFTKFLKNQTYHESDYYRVTK